MIYRAVIRDLRRCSYECSSAISYRPPLKTAIAADACARICMNERIVRANSTVLIRITIDSALPAAPPESISACNISENSAAREYQMLTTLDEQDRVGG